MGGGPYHLDGSVASVVYTNAQVLTPSVTWSYDPAFPRVATMVDGTGTTTYTYHPVGQLGAGQVATVDGPLANDGISYTYDQLGRVTTRAIDGVPLTLTYDALGRVEQEVNVLGAFGYTYDGVSGRLATVTYPNNQTSTYSYVDAVADHRLQTIHHRYPSGAILSKFDYTYDAVGNIQTWRQQADTTAVIWDYGYDGADQLIRAVKRATDPQGSILQRFAYGYDPAGNRLFEQIDDRVTAWTYDRLNRLVTQEAGGWLRVGGTVNEAATVRVNGQPAAIDAAGLFVGGVQVAPGTTRFAVTATDASGNTATQQYDVDQVGVPKTFTFDANGNLTSDGTRTLEWDARNQLVTVLWGGRRTEFAYDGLKRRTRSVEQEHAQSRNFAWLWCGSRVCRSQETDPLSETTYQTRGYDTDGGGRFQTRDHLGSVRDVTDSTGVLQQRSEFAPFGLRTGIDEPTHEYEMAFATHLAQIDSGILLSWYRPYDPALGRWLTEDPLGLDGGINRYVYVGSNPIKYVDPLGLVAWTCNYDFTSVNAPTLGPGGGVLRIECTSKCSSGHRVWARLLGFGVGGSGGPFPGGYSGSGIQIRDSFARADATNLAGPFSYTSFGAAAGPWGWSGTLLQLGAAGGRSVGFGTYGADLGLDAYTGGAALVDSRTEKCCR